MGTKCEFTKPPKRPACQFGRGLQMFSARRGVSLTATNTGKKDTIVCNAVPRVYAAGEMSWIVQVSLMSSVDFHLYPGRCHFAPPEAPVCIYGGVHLRMGPSRLSCGPVVAYLDYNPRERFVHRLTSVVN